MADRVHVAADRWRVVGGMTRRRLAGAVAAVGTLGAAAGAAACGQGQQASSTPARALAPAQLQLWKLPHGPADAEEGMARPVLDGFKAAHPNVSVTLTLTPDWAQKYAAAFAAGTPPDVAYMTEPLAAYALNKHLLALDPFLAKNAALKNDVQPTLWAFSMVEGKTYGVPWLTNCSLLFYNKTLFQRAGLDPAKPPATWDQLLDAARKLTSAGEGRFGYGVGPADWIENLYWAQQAGGEWLTPDLKKSTINSPQSVAGIEFLVDLVRRHQVATTEMHAPGFQQDRVAMMTHRPPQARAALQARSDFPLGLAPRPKGPAAEPKGRAAYRGVGAASIAAATKAPDQSWALVEHVLQPEGLRAWIKGLGQLSPRKSVAFYADDPVFKVFEDNTQYAYPTPPVKAWDEFIAIMRDAVAKALRGEVTTKVALDDAARQADLLLAR
jgi:multiple sugar transport system substrate-binding protein